MKQIRFPAIKDFLSEKDRKKVHHVELAIPGQDLQLWIMDASLLIADSGPARGKAVIYFSANNRSKQGDRICKTAEMLDTFSTYEVQEVSRRFIRYKIVNPVYDELIREISVIVNDLFPKLELSSIKAALHRRDNWVTLDN